MPIGREDRDDFKRSLIKAEWTINTLEARLAHVDGAGPLAAIARALLDSNRILLGEFDEMEDPAPEDLDLDAEWRRLQDPDAA